MQCTHTRTSEQAPIDALSLAHAARHIERHPPWSEIDRANSERLNDIIDAALDLMEMIDEYTEDHDDDGCKCRFCTQDEYIVQDDLIGLRWAVNQGYSCLSSVVIPRMRVAEADVPSVVVH